MRRHLLFIFLMIVLGCKEGKVGEVNYNYYGNDNVADTTVDTYDDVLLSDNMSCVCEICGCEKCADCAACACNDCGSGDYKSVEIFETVEDYLTNDFIEISQKESQIESFETDTPNKEVSVAETGETTVNEVGAESSESGFEETAKVEVAQEIVVPLTGCENSYFLCFYYDSDSAVVVITGLWFDYYQEAVFFTGKVDSPYLNLKVATIIDATEFVAYLPVPSDKVYKLFNLVGSGGAWMLIDPIKKIPALGNGLEYWCNADGACAILISERKDF